MGGQHRKMLVGAEGAAVGVAQVEDVDGWVVVGGVVTDVYLPIMNM